MSHAYRAVGWNRQKRIYDGVFLACVLLYLGLFIGVGAVVRPGATIETLLLRAFGMAALLMLHVVLSIGPLCRLDVRFLPLLYNRRHLGVATFLVGSVHGALSLFQFHALGDVNPLVSLFTSNTRFDSLSQFPFQPLGFLALSILFLMAATSHDFWLVNLTAPVWKTLHMLVYAAYGLLVAHVTLGVLQAETSPWLAGALGAGVVWVLGLHLVAGYRERARDRPDGTSGPGGFVEVCGVDEIAENRARTVCLSGERVAVFRYDGKISAVSNVCQHQNGPLGEGRIVDGCITCPWHGFQYLPDSGASPPPFTEKIPTFRVRVEHGRVFVDPRPNPAGTRVEPARITGSSGPVAERHVGEFYVGYLKEAPARIARHVRAAVVAVFALAALSAVIFATGQQRFDPGVFEFGVSREFVGVLRREPYPVLYVPRPGRGAARATPSVYWLVATGKFGALEVTAGHDGQPVRLRGSLIYRDGLTMIEVEAGSVEELSGEAARELGPLELPQREDLGERTLRGEIVDSKCFLGVMKPGHLKPHRSCAVRCISGGIPPVLVVLDVQGRATYYLLASAAGAPVRQEVLDFVAEPVEISGRVVRHGERLVLHADPATYRRDHDYHVWPLVGGGDP